MIAHEQKHQLQHVQQEPQVLQHANMGGAGRTWLTFMVTLHTFYAVPLYAGPGPHILFGQHSKTNYFGRC